MSKVLVCSTARFIIGGNETLIYRQFKYASKQGFRCVLVIPQLGEYEKSWDKQLKEIGVEIFRYIRNWHWIKGHIVNDDERLRFRNDDEVTWISNKWDLYILSAYFQRECTIKTFNKIFYVVHPFHTVFFEKNSLLNKAVKKLWINKIIHNGLVFMDDESKNYSISHYGKNIDAPIIRLGCLDDNVEHIRPVFRREIKLLTIGRLEFPFKEYVLGVVDVVSTLINQGYKIQLTIVGDGSDRDILQEKLDSIDSKTKKSIQWVGEVLPDKLKDYYSRCNLYIGCGATLIEASSYYVPSIIVYSYQHEDKCVGFFSENKRCIGLIEGDKGPVRKMSDCILQVIDMNDLEYNNFCNEARKTFEEHYSIERNLEQLSLITDKKWTRLELIESELLFAYYKLIGTIKSS